MERACVRHARLRARREGMRAICVVACEAIDPKGRDARSNAKAARRVIAARGPSRPRGCSAEWSDPEKSGPSGALLRARSKEAGQGRDAIAAGALGRQPLLAGIDKFGRGALAAQHGVDGARGPAPASS